MKILFIDKNKELHDLSELLSMKEHSIEYCEDYNNGQNLYNSDTFDIVFINFSVEYFEKIFKYISNRSTKQKVVIFAEALKCEKQKNSQLNQLKPIFPTKFKKYIKSFDTSICIYTDRQNGSYGLYEIVNTVVRRYRSAICYSDTKALSISNINNLIAIGELVKYF